MNVSKIRIKNFLLCSCTYLHVNELQMMQQKCLLQHLFLFNIENSLYEPLHWQLQISPPFWCNIQRAPFCWNLFQHLTLYPSPILHKWREALNEAGMTDSPEKTSGNPPTFPGPLTVCDPSPLTRTNAKLQSDLCTQTDGEDTKPPTPPTTFLCGHCKRSAKRHAFF